MDLKNIEMFLFDMDGTIYLDDDVFDGAIELINLINKKQKRIIYLTNNSSKSKDQYIKKLNKLGFFAKDENVFTSGMAMGMFLNKNYKNKKVFLVGTNALKDELLKFDVVLVEEDPDIVLVGFDRELNYLKLEKACEFLCNGAIFLATNCDLVCPIANHRYIPDCGSICNMLTVATGKTPKYIGKPEPDMINIISEKYSINPKSIAMIGDRVYTDITAGYNAGTYTICVLSGESTLKTIENSVVKPDLIVNSVKDLINMI